MSLRAEAAAAMRCTEEEIAAWVERGLQDAPNPRDNPEAARRIMRQLAKYRRPADPSGDRGDADDAA